ncbi:MAG: polysaccharide biosynthesis protein [Micromonosporaceae bacterium]|nr:polysaccharide biosynthesis protein [Micromonosporaceae bacterium]
MTNATRTAALPRTGVLASARSFLGAGAVVGAATVAMNALAFVVPLVAARVLTAEDLGALSALLAVGAIAGTVGVGLQTALAVRWAKHDTVWGAGRVSLLAATVTTGILLAAGPVLSAILDLPLVQPLLLGLLTFPVVLAGRWLGEMQGRRRYGLLAGGLVLLSAGRFGGIMVALVAGAGVTGSLAVGVIAASAAIVAIASLCGHGPRVIRDRAAARWNGWAARWNGQTARWTGQAPDGTGQAATSLSGPDHARVSGREVLRASAATIAMLAVSYADLVLARALLSAAESGAYAVGSVLTKGAIWAPAAVTVLALPAFAQARRNAVRITVLCTAASGVVLVTAAALFGGLAIALASAGKDGYQWLAPYAYGFGTVGALYALVYVFVNAEIAAMARHPALGLWLGLGLIVAGAAITRPSTVGSMLVLSLVTAAVTTLAMALAYWLRRRTAPVARPVDGEPTPSA